MDYLVFFCFFDPPPSPVWLPIRLRTQDRTVRKSVFNAKTVQFSFCSALAVNKLTPHRRTRLGSPFGSAASMSCLSVVFYSIEYYDYSEKQLNIKAIAFGFLQVSSPPITVLVFWFRKWKYVSIRERVYRKQNILNLSISNGKRCRKKCTPILVYEHVQLYVFKTEQQGARGVLLGVWALPMPLI